ncbi:MarR family winged helix-turn-helix transcriptional regulator [Streptomyces sp. NPDC050161]|uniref:MarR family winged helix-turn-helix transcriptional regulator n=1 Tax=Streptomyces sp. NPDC050161 TaxID=3365604 RepID=UPI003791B1BE
MEGRHNKAQDDNAGPEAPGASAAGVDELAQAADALFYAMRRARSVAGQAGSGLTLAQLALLEPLAADDELPVGRLAAAAGVSVPTATRMLQQLESKGSVTRHRSPADERRVLVGLTEEGLRQLTAVRARLRERQTRTLARIPSGERARLTRQLHDLAEAITALDA